MYMGDMGVRESYSGIDKSCGSGSGRSCASDHGVMRVPQELRE